MGLKNKQRIRGHEADCPSKRVFDEVRKELFPPRDKKVFRNAANMSEVLQASKTGGIQCRRIEEMKEMRQQLQRHAREHRRE